MKKIILLVLVLALSFSSCEKDDICDANTPTTPRLIVEFYDSTAPTVLKNVTDLKVTGVGASTDLSFNGVSKIQLPLKTTEDATSYSFTLNSGNSVTASVDDIKFDYTRKDVFISRACGFKTVFTLNTITLNDTPNSKLGNWIKDIIIATSNIETENETHIKIYF